MHRTLWTYYSHYLSTHPLITRSLTAGCMEFDIQSKREPDWIKLNSLSLTNNLIFTPFLFIPGILCLGDVVAQKIEKSALISPQIESYSENKILLQTGKEQHNWKRSAIMFTVGLTVIGPNVHR